MSSSTQVLVRKPQNVAVETNPAHELNLVDAETPEPGPNECLVHVRATGICGSDVHFWKEGRIGSSIIDRPVGLGHESAGVVVKLGSQCDRLKVGKIPSSLHHIIAILHLQQQTWCKVLKFSPSLPRRSRRPRMRSSLFQTHLHSLSYRTL